MGFTIDELSLGQSASFSKTISESDVYLFAGITGDFNPAHTNSSFATETFFRRRIAHGMLSASLISTVLGTQLPGPGSIYVEQHLSFKAPVYFGDTITANVVVEEIFHEKNRVKLFTSCTNQDGVPVVVGYAIMLPAK